MDAKPEVIDVFLCHNGADKDWVRELGEQIESETLDGTGSSRKLSVFFDEWDIAEGENVLLRLNQGLTVARFVAVVISPEMLNAPWPAFEWTHIATGDPTNKQGRLIPLFLHDYSEKLDQRAELPAPFRALKWIDFRKKSDFKRSFLRLIRKIRGLPPQRGSQRRPIASTPTQPIVPLESDLSATPDPVHDVVLGNLLPIESYPRTIWSAPTPARKKQQIWDNLPDAPAFELQEGRLYSFVDLSTPNNVFSGQIDSKDIKDHPVAGWRTNEAKWRWFVTLMNACVNNAIGKFPIRRDKKGRYFFLPGKDKTDRVWTNGSDHARTVAARKSNPKGDFWVHQGAELRVITLGDHLFLSIEPCYVFTADGRNALAGQAVGPLSIKWGGKERNAAILRHVVFWARTLGQCKRKIEIPSGAKEIVISGIPALSRTTFGIEFDQISFRSLLRQVEDELSQVADAFSGNPGTEDSDSDQE